MSAAKHTPWTARLEVHEHSFVSGRHGHVVHSHEGGNVPHEHPDTGPASYTRGKKKLTARPNGEQFLFVSMEPQTFDVFVLDSALVPDGQGGLRPISPADELGASLQQEHIERTFRHLRGVVHDLRTYRRSAP